MKSKVLLPITTILIPFTQIYLFSLIYKRISSFLQLHLFIYSVTILNEIASRDAGLFIYPLYIPTEDATFFLITDRLVTTQYTEFKRTFRVIGH